MVCTKGIIINMNKISPSILSADFTNLLADINKVQNADMLHVDVMDGHFVPNISIGVPVVESIRKNSDMFLDVHLMITNPLSYVQAFAKAGADLICFHVESDSDVKETISLIRSCGKKVGIALKPKTKAIEIESVIDLVDMVLIMTVEPGFGGQSFMGDMVTKITEIRTMAKSKGLNLDIQVDGGINLETAKLCVDAGANVLVAGSFIFGGNEQAKLVTQLQDL